MGAVILATLAASFVAAAVKDVPSTGPLAGSTSSPTPTDVLPTEEPLPTDSPSAQATDTTAPTTTEEPSVEPTTISQADDDEKLDLPKTGEGGARGVWLLGAAAALAALARRRASA